MKRIMLLGLVSFLLLSGVTVAQQTGDEKKDSSMGGMMQEMMREKQGSGESMQGMGGTDRMMRMMKMMDQCSAMMESSHSSEGAKESQK
jgi:hypothetical protein